MKQTCPDHCKLAKGALALGSAFKSTGFNYYANCASPDQTAHMHGLIRAHAVCICRKIGFDMTWII